MKYTLQSNQYIPRKSKSLPSGMPACATYWYITDENSKTINIKTFKPYRGKEMSNYAMHSKTQAQSLVDYLNNLVELNKNHEDFVINTKCTKSNTYYE